MLVSGRVYYLYRGNSQMIWRAFSTNLNWFFFALRFLGHHFFQHRFLTDVWILLECLISDTRIAWHKAKQVRLEFQNKMSLPQNPAYIIQLMEHGRIKKNIIHTNWFLSPMFTNLRNSTHAYPWTHKVSPILLIFQVSLHRWFSAAPPSTAVKTWHALFFGICLVPFSWPSAFPFRYNPKY